MTNKSDIDAAMATSTKALREAIPVKLTPAQQVRKSEAALITRGGRRMPSGHLQPDAAQALAELLSAGYAKSTVAVIVVALLDARKKINHTGACTQHTDCHPCCAATLASTETACTGKQVCRKS